MIFSIFTEVFAFALFQLERVGNWSQVSHCPSQQSTGRWTFIFLKLPSRYVKVNCVSGRGWLLQTAIHWELCQNKPYFDTAQRRLPTDTAVPAHELARIAACAARPQLSSPRRTADQQLAERARAIGRARTSTGALRVSGGRLLSFAWNIRWFIKLWSVNTDFHVSLKWRHGVMFARHAVACVVWNEDLCSCWRHSSLVRKPVLAELDPRKQLLTFGLIGDSNYTRILDCSFRRP